MRREPGLILRFSKVRVSAKRRVISVVPAGQLSLISFRFARGAARSRPRRDSAAPVLIMAF